MAAPVTTRNRRRPARTLERDAGLQLERLEHAITTHLAECECRESCAELSAYLDGLCDHERLDALLVAQAIGVAS